MAQLIRSNDGGTPRRLLLNALGGRPIIPHESLCAGILLSLLFFAALHESAAGTEHEFVGAAGAGPKLRVKQWRSKMVAEAGS